MIEFTRGYKVGDKVFATLQEAQTHELEMLLNEIDCKGNNLELARELTKHCDRIIDILSTKATSKPRARKINGGKKTRKAENHQPQPC